MCAIRLLSGIKEAGFCHRYLADVSLLYCRPPGAVPEHVAAFAAGGDNNRTWFQYLLPAKTMSRSRYTLGDGLDLI